MVTVKINGKEITVEDGTLILDAAREAGVEIPTFCYQADLLGVGSCRMCLVEIEGQKKLQPSCITPVMHDMSIQTDTPSVVNARAGVLEFLLANHAMDCPVCDKGGECELQDMVYTHGPRKGRHAEKKYRWHEKDYVLSPVIVKNSNRCVQCMKCVRVCREVVGANVLGSMNRGYQQEETSFGREYLDCDHCGNCIEVCPVGCFMRLPYRYKARPWDLTGADSVCPFCATGCRIVVEERAGEAVRSKAQLGVGINSEQLCARGRFGFDFIKNDQRLTTPLVRKNGSLERATWDEALEFIKENLGSVRGERLGGVASPRLTNEELYTFQKLFRETFKSPNVDSTSRWDPSTVEAFIEAADIDRGGASMFDVIGADTVLVVGGYLSEENPVVDYTIRRLELASPKNVIVASPRGMKLDSSAAVSVRHLPAEEGKFLESLAHGLYDTNSERLASVGAARSVAGKSLNELLDAAGITKDQADEVVKKLNSAESVGIVAGTDFLRFGQGIAALKALKEVLRALGKETSVLPVLDRNNQRGAWEMGVHPWLAPGLARPTVKGKSTGEMLRAASGGELRAMYVASTDVVSMYPDEGFAKEALAKLDLLIVQDIFLTETAKLAHVVLPGSSFVEKSGTFTNQEGRVQSITGLLPPPGKARRDHAVMGMVARLFDKDFVSAPAEVFEEIREAVPSYKDVSLEFNNKRNKENKLDNRAALVGGSPGFSPAGEITPTPGPTGGGEFLLVTGNHFFHSGNVSMKSETLTKLAKEAVVEISDSDAGRMDLKDGDKARVAGKNYEAVLLVKIRKGTRAGVAFIAENFPDVPVNRFFMQGEGIARVSIKKA